MVLHTGPPLHTALTAVSVLLASLQAAFSRMLSCILMLTACPYICKRTTTHDGVCVHPLMRQAKQPNEDVVFIDSFVGTTDWRSKHCLVSHALRTVGVQFGQ